MSFLIIFFLSFLAGSLVKLTDDIEDKNLGIHRLYAIPTGLAYGFVMGNLMLIDIDVSFLFGGIILGCLLTGKIDSRGHYSGMGAILTMVFLFGVKLSPLVLLITILAALDEIRVDILTILILFALLRSPASKVFIKVDPYDLICCKVNFK